MVQYEAEILKLESFGVDLLHTIGLIYTQKATTCLKSSKFLGLGGLWFRTKERGTLVKSAWGTMSSAVDASIAGSAPAWPLLSNNHHSTANPLISRKDE